MLCFVVRALVLTHTNTDSVSVPHHWPPDYSLLLFKWAEWKLIKQTKTVFMLAFILKRLPQKVLDSKILNGFAEGVFCGGLHLPACLDCTWLKVRFIRPERDFCCGSDRVRSCARQRPLPHTTVESWVVQGAALQSFQLGKARAFSCMSHYPLKLLPFLIRNQLNLFGNSTIM